MTMLAEERRTKILALLHAKGVVTVAELAQDCNVANETIRRDLDVLDRQGLLKRIHGGAQLIQNDLEIPFDIRKQTNVDEKRRIAKKAVRFVSPGDTLFLDISSTALFFAKELSGLQNITVITNSVRIAHEFINKKELTFISTGGILRPNSYSLVGPLTNNAVRNYRADIFFTSCRGFSLRHGVSDSNELENEVKKTMLSRSAKLYLLMDHTKINKVGLTQFATINDIHAIISDDKISEGDAQLIREAGIKLF